MANLLDDLLLHFQSTAKGYSEYKSRAKLLDLVFPELSLYMEKNTSLARSEEYRKYYESDFRENKNCYKYIYDEKSICQERGRTWKSIRMEAIGKFVENCQIEGMLQDLKECLMELIDDTTIHDPKLAIKLQAAIGRLKTFGENRLNFLDANALEAWKLHIYYYFYFAVTDKLHSDMALSLYPELEEDLEEYNNQVTMMYGVCGNPGMYTVYALANKERPNIIALYECGELEYYGKGPSGKVNYEKAYDYYERTKECNNEHPLATWSIAYMRFHYSQEHARLHPEYRVQQFEDELKSGKRNAWYNTILYNAETAYDNGCSAAANLLGKIVNSPEEVFPMARRGKFKNRSAKGLFKESADAGYVFGCNNYASICCKEADRTQNETEKKELLKEAIFYLERSAILGNPWAANKIGKFYLDGVKVGNNTVMEQDIEKAHDRFGYAVAMIFAEKYYWPLINLCKHFWLSEQSKWYLERDIEEILELLKRATLEIDELIEGAIAERDDQEKRQLGEQREQLKNLSEMAEKIANA